MNILETFQCGGLAPNILASPQPRVGCAHGVLGGDPMGAWSLKSITHIWVEHQQAPGVQFQAEFIRDQDFEVVS